MSTKNFDLKDFRNIQAGGAIQLIIMYSDRYGINVTADDFDYVTVEKNGDNLFLGRRGIDWLFPFHIRPEFRIEMPTLEALTISGATQGLITGFNVAGDICISISGASHFNFENVSVANVRFRVSGASHLRGNIKVENEATFEVSGASNLELAGSTQNMFLDITGASHSYLGRFHIGNADVKLSGASRATVNVNGRLNTEINGASKLDWLGSPVMGDLVIAGASSFHRK